GSPGLSLPGCRPSADCHRIAVGVVPHARYGAGRDDVLALFGELTDEDRRCSVHSGRSPLRDVGTWNGAPFGQLAALSRAVRSRKTVCSFAYFPTADFDGLPNAGLSPPNGDQARVTAILAARSPRRPRGNEIASALVGPAG